MKGDTLCIGLGHVLFVKHAPVVNLQEVECMVLAKWGQQLLSSALHSACTILFSIIAVFFCIAPARFCIMQCSLWNKASHRAVHLAVANGSANMACSARKVASLAQGLLL